MASVIVRERLGQLRSCLWFGVLVGCHILGLGSGIAQTGLTRLASSAALATLAGGTFGILRPIGANARIFGPVVASELYERSQ
ncbi:MAG: hypothetical protein JNM34_06545 [Chthonomonadaceae bacterium]|nr:hypothetical protein [Chthonomonadaceae bacterium]